MDNCKDTIMKTKSILSLLVMLFALGTTTFSCKKDKTTTSSNPENPTQNEITGYINGLFSVNDSVQVYFSQGNLQYKASTNTWRFAENQYDIIGDGNANIASDYDDWIDLFGWGTSGYNHGAVCYQPWSTSIDSDDYHAYGNENSNLYDQTGQADWGYNAISNGGGTINSWRTLRYQEWAYVFNTRNTSSGIRFAPAQVNEVNGMIVLPDNWDPATYSLDGVNSYESSYTTNAITAESWSVMENAGAVFMPAAGIRDVTHVTAIEYTGAYWSSSQADGQEAVFVRFNDGGFDPSNVSTRCLGFSVRLVHQAQ